MSVAALFVVMTFQNCDFIGGPMGQALRSLAGGSSLPDGVYGISPTALQLKDSRRGSFSNLVVRSSGAGKDGLLNTNFDTGNITGLKANTTYYLDVRGISGANGGTETPLSNYSVSTWDTFANATWAMNATSGDNGTLSLSGSANTITWTYAPWNTTPAGDGVLANTSVQCFIVPDQGPSTDPFVAGAKSVQGPAAAGRLAFTAADVGVSGNVRVGCQVNYADKTVSKSLLRRQTLLLPAVGKCPGDNIAVYMKFSCGIADVAGPTAAGSGMTFSLDPSNTCGFVSVVNNALTGTPRDPAVGTCSLAFTLSSGGATSPVIRQTLTIKNAKAVWTRTPNDPSPLREITKNDPGALTGSVLNLQALQANPNYTLHMADQFQTNKAAFGAADGATYGAYKLDLTTLNNCGQYGRFAYVDATGKPVTGINPANGEFYFQPYEHFWGPCTVDIYFDDGHPTDNKSDNISIPVKILGYNDPPELGSQNLPKTGVNGAEYMTCGTDSSASCYVGVDYTITLPANTGGKSADFPNKPLEDDQKLMIKPGNCVVQNSDTSDTKPYVALNYCELKDGNIQIGFQPLDIPAASSTNRVTIKVIVSDNGQRSVAMGSAYNPNTSGTNSSCLAGVGCQSYPASYQDSTAYAVTLKLGKFNLPIAPALIVSKAACLGCHITVEQGDFVTDFGNKTPGVTAGGRFANEFWNGNNDWGSSATHILGFRALNQVAGSLYTKRAQLTAAANPSFFDRVGNLTGRAGRTYPQYLRNDRTAVVDLVDFLTSPNWTILQFTPAPENRPYDDQQKDEYNLKPSAFAAVCGPDPDINDRAVNGKTCQTAPVRDTVSNASGETPINYMTISVPTPEDIAAIAKISANEAARALFASATSVGAAALYIQPQDTTATGPRPFSGFKVSSDQPASARAPGAASLGAKQSYVTNSGSIECYGDVVVKGDLFLESPTFLSDKRGCRIHVTGSVIMHAAASTDPNAPAVGSSVMGPGNVGVQITSSVGIAIGFTLTEMALRGVPVAVQTFHSNLNLPVTADCLSGTTFSGYADMTNRICAARSAPPSDETTLPPGYQGWGWGHVSYTGLMLNAPNIQGRYVGEVVGSIIADFALFRLGNLKFKFDSRFNGQVPFPRLQTISSSVGNHPRVVFDFGPCNNNAQDSWQCDVNAVQ